MNYEVFANVEYANDEMCFEETPGCDSSFDIRCSVFGVRYSKNGLE